jgi:integrase/recombinase XerD
VRKHHRNGLSTTPPPPPQAAGLEAQKEAYLRHQTLKNLTRLSLRQNEQAIRLFIVWLHEQDIYSVHRVTRQTVERYKAALMSQPSRRGPALSFNTVRGRLFILQRWFAWMRKKGWIGLDPARDVQAPPMVKRLPRGVMTEAEVRAVMAKPDRKTLLGYRDRTIMEVLYSTGMRAAEARDVEVRDVDLAKRLARVRNGKGGKERYVPLSSPACYYLDRYVRRVRPELARGVRPSGKNWLKKYQTGGDALFLTVYGGKLTTQWLAQTMAGYIRAAGIERAVSPVHGWRHTAATHLLEGGLDVRYVQSFLGHANINTSTIYMRVAHERLARQVKEFHPRSRHGDFKPFLGAGS